MAKKRRYLISLTVLLVAATVLAVVFRKELACFITDLLSGEITREDAKAYFSARFQTREAVVLALVSAAQVVCPFFPAEPIQVVAGLAYGVLPGSAIVLSGVFVGNTIVFLLYKLLGDRFAKYMGDNLTVDLAAPASQRALVVLIAVMYFLPAIPYGMICLIAASSGMRYPRFIAVTVLLTLPSIFVGILIGSLAIRAGLVTSVIVLFLLIGLIITASVKRDKLMALANRLIERANQHAKNGKAAH